MALADVLLVAKPGETHLSIDGADVTDQVRTVQVRTDGRGMPEVLLELASGRVDFQGTADVVVVNDESVADWVAGIDPEALDAAVLEELNGEDPASAPVLCLRVLQRWASGH